MAVAKSNRYGQTYGPMSTHTSSTHNYVLVMIAHTTDMASINRPKVHMF
jgi:hypothetical protein